jgi:hypothetical protein
MKKNFKLEKLQKGETIITSEKGNSMSPLIKSKQKHKLKPVKDWKKEIEPGDIVYCKVRGNFYTHLVKAKQEAHGCLIGNNKGGINGWTTQIYGKVTEIL